MTGTEGGAETNGAPDAGPSSPPPADAGAPERTPSAPAGPPAWIAGALAAVTALVLAPALGGGWLDYDDGWLVRDNAILAAPTLASLRSITLDLSRETRLALGAEYLPLRDLFVWVLVGVLGAPVWALHAAQIAVYVGGALLVRRWLHLVFGSSRATELAAWLFALHPVHVEAAAWLASIKDVLLLALAAGALVLWASPRPRDRSIAVGLVACACLAKGAGVVVPLLFVVSDLAIGRPVDRRRLGVALLVAGLATALHAHVGAVVGMYAEPIGGSRTIAAASMVVVAWRYLALSCGVGAHSIVYEVDALSPAAPAVLLGALGLVLLALAAAAAHRRGLRWPLAACLLFAIPLLPVSQVLAPLQNQMADRYLLLAVLGPCVALGHAVMLGAERAGGRLPQIAAVGLPAIAGMLALVRAMTFASPVAVFAEATERTRRATVAPYQLAMALEALERDTEAEVAYREAMRRDGLRTDHGRQAGNNLGRLLARNGRLPEAAALYRDLRARYPDDPRLLRNLAIVLERSGEAAEAAALRAELAERFPDYERTRLERRVGP